MNATTYAYLAAMQSMGKPLVRDVVALVAGSSERAKAKRAWVDSFWQHGLDYWDTVRELLVPVLDGCYVPLASWNKHAVLPHYWPPRSAAWARLSPLHLEAVGAALAWAEEE